MRAHQASYAFVAVVLTVWACEPPDPAPFNDSIQAEELSADLHFLAGDAMRGRLVGTPEIARAADFIAARFDSLGLEPAGEDGSFFQPFDLNWFSLRAGNTLRVEEGGIGGRSRLPGDGYYPLNFSASATVTGELAFVGFGIVEPDLSFDDYRGQDVSGKIVLVLEREPGVTDPESPFDGVVTAESSAAWRKAISAQERGAVGILFVRDVHNRPDFSDFAETARGYWPNTPRRIERFTLGVWMERIRIPAAQVSADLAEDLVAGTGRTLQDLAEASETAAGLGALNLPGPVVSIYDAIEWALNYLPNDNGRVGQWGISYPGWQTVMGMIDRHPALVASSPQASPSDMFIGDDWHHNGAFRIMYAFSWLSGNARVRNAPTEASSGRFDYGTPWGYEFFLNAGSAANIDEKYFQGDVIAWNDFMEHGTYDEYWQQQNALLHLDGIDHAVLNVAGWFDTEDFYGPMSIYRTVEEMSPASQNTLVVGPWLHGGWRRMEGDFLGRVEFGTPTSLDFQNRAQAPFFRRHLKGEGDWSAPEAVVFETGTNEWRTYDRWPPPGVSATNLYLREDGTLSFDEATETGADASDSYVSDPNHPVPFSAEIRTTLGHLWKVEDQRFASTRPDVLTYVSEPLTEDLTIAGPILADIYVSTTGTDSDWVVKLIDVYPGDAPQRESCDVPMGGFQMHVAGEIMRGKFRNNLENPEPMVPGEVARIDIDLKDKCHTFLAGHRIMVHVQSSWFPAYDRNPQTFVDIYHAQPEDYQVATQTVYRGVEAPSHLVLGVMR